LVSLYDYRCNLQVNLRAAFDTVNFHIPRSVLDGLAHDLVGGRVSDLTVKQGSCLDDPVIRSLGAAVLPALENPESANLLFLDHIGWALAAHVAKAYGDAVPMTSRGGLAPWQERRAKEIMATQLDGNVRLADLAAACGLSTGHFVRAFRRTTNTTPYRWLLQLRLEQAQALMAGTSLPLASIALQCGFADQSHFTRTFNRILGVSPGLWRRNRRPGSPDGDMALKAALGTGATLVTKEGFTA
jgi:AraC family transcriptional regulator